MVQERILESHEIDDVTSTNRSKIVLVCSSSSTDCETDENIDNYQLVDDLDSQLNNSGKMISAIISRVSKFGTSNLVSTSKSSTTKRQSSRPDTTLWAPLLITIGPPLAGKDHFIDSLQEDVDAIAVDDYPDLYRSYSIPSYLQLTIDHETEQSLLVMLFQKMITIDEFNVRLTTVIRDPVLHQMVTTTVAQVYRFREDIQQPLMRTLRIEVINRDRDVINAASLSALKHIKYALKHHAGFICWKNCNLTPEFYLDVLSHAAKYKRIVRFIRWGEELNPVSLVELYRRNVIRFLDTGRYTDAMSLSTYLSMTERMMELDQPYSRKRTHQDLVNIAGYQMDELGRVYHNTKCPFPLHVVSTHKQVMEEQRVPWLQWTNRSCLIPLNKGKTVYSGKPTNIYLSSASTTSPILPTNTTTTRIRSNTVQCNDNNNEDNDSMYNRLEVCVEECKESEDNNDGPGSGGSQWNGVRLTLDDIVLTSPRANSQREGYRNNPLLANNSGSDVDGKLHISGVHGVGSDSSFSSRNTSGTITDAEHDDDYRCDTIRQEDNDNDGPIVIAHHTISDKDQQSVTGSCDVQASGRHHKSIGSDTSEWGNFVDLDVSTRPINSPTTFSTNNTTYDLQTMQKYHQPQTPVKEVDMKTPIMDPKIEQEMTSSGCGQKCCTFRL